MAGLDGQTERQASRIVAVDESLRRLLLLLLLPRRISKTRRRRLSREIKCDIFIRRQL